MQHRIATMLFISLQFLGKEAIAAPTFDEAMMVCDNMTLYVNSAQRQRSMGTGEDEATQFMLASIERNFETTADVKSGVKDLMTKIYSYVYNSPGGQTATVETVLTHTCGRYQGSTFSTDLVAKHLAETAQSAWKPLLRVPLCTKVAESAANIAAARDKGLSRDLIKQVSQQALANDSYTSARLTNLISQAYDYPGDSIGFIYVHNFGRCNAERRNGSFPDPVELRAAFAGCQAISVKEDRSSCIDKAFQLNGGTP